ncbi:MAG: pyridoxamine 5'-phosphate oxidase family protein [Gammaproteobacteria bacterium]|nr:pyridoxamine 5'-phosphate oxidase family protein [Gammaproteobacteria bacterium]
MPKLNASERDQFLATPGIIMKIACIREDGSPLVTPIWFILHNKAIQFTPRARSEWLTCLRNDPRVALCIDEQNLPYRKVILEGRAELLHDVGEDDRWRDLYRSIAKRYIQEDSAEAYILNTIDQPRALFQLKLVDATVKTWRMPIDDEPQTGIWHQRYYAPGSKYSNKPGSNPE